MPIAERSWEHWVITRRASWLLSVLVSVSACSSDHDVGARDEGGSLEVGDAAATPAISAEPATCAPRRAAVPGTVVWSRVGHLQVDAQRNFFVRSDTAPATLQRVNPNDGVPLWSRAIASSSVTFDAACNRSGSALLKTKTGLASISVADGSSRWTRTFETLGIASDAEPWLSCAGPAEVVLVQHGRVREKVTAVQRSTGDRLWSYSRELPLEVVGAAGSTLILHESSFGLQASALIALDVQSGAVKWQLRDPAQNASVDETGHVVVNHLRDLTRLDASTGQAIWRVETKAYPVVTRTANGLYVTDERELHRLDPDTGKTLWQTTLEARSSVVYLSSSIAVGFALAPSHLVVTMLEASDGTTRWRRDMPKVSAELLVDGEKRLFARESASLTRLDEATGEVLWSTHYAFPHDAGRATYGSDFPAHLNAIVAADPLRVVESYTNAGYKFPKSGLLAFDATSGAIRWDYFENGFVSVIGETPEVVLLSDGMAGPMIRAIAK